MCWWTAAMTMVINEYYSNNFWFRTPACLQTSLKKTTIRFNFLLFLRSEKIHINIITFIDENFG